MANPNMVPKLTDIGYRSLYRIQSHITHIQHTSILPTLILTSVVHHPTTSFNPILIHSNTTPPFCHLVTQIFQYLPPPLRPPLPQIFPPPQNPRLPRLSGTTPRQHCDKYLTHPTSSLEPLPLKISPQLFHSKLKTLLFSKSYPDSSSFPCLPPRLNSKHHPP